MTAQDVRWIRHLNNFSKAMAQLTKFIEKGDLNELEKQGLIHAFGYTYELAWNTLKDFFEAQGETDIYGSRDVFRLAFRRGLIENGEAWMDMIKSRNLTSHTYDEAVASEIVSAILESYFAEFEALKATLEELKLEEQV
ncbi:MAG TPA: nucleotidyltransferase substrate binding protein [bacterium]|nr:nucleotidyltransferase substrate binding protein [bacterium]